MEWLNDSNACLDVANTMIYDIEELVKESIKHNDLIPYIKVNIKNCLENCRSPLDYAANYIFDTYCKSEYTTKELGRMKTYFPIRSKEDSFDRCIRDNFRNLINKKRNLVNVIKKYQPFNNDPWLQHLTVLINENKHRNLTKQSKEQTAHIESAQIGGITIKNFTMVNVAIPVKIGDTKVDFVNPSPYDHLFDASVEIEYFFDELELSVLPTLTKIHGGVKSIIYELEKSIEGE